VGFDVVFAEPDDSSGLRTLDALAKKELRDVPAYSAALRELRPQLDNDARFAESMKNRPVILGYYFSSKEGWRQFRRAPAAGFPGWNVCRTTHRISPSGLATAATCPNSKKLPPGRDISIRWWMVTGPPAGFLCWSNTKEQYYESLSLGDGAQPAWAIR
jgi:hypothetical protein